MCEGCCGTGRQKPEGGKEVPCKECTGALKVGDIVTCNVRMHCGASFEILYIHGGRAFCKSLRDNAAYAFGLRLLTKVPKKKKYWVIHLQRLNWVFCNTRDSQEAANSAARKYAALGHKVLKVEEHEYEVEE